MSEAKAFRLKIDDQHIAWLAIDVPGEKMNTLQAAFAQEMQDVFKQLDEQKKQLKGLIIYSLKPDNFIAGADVRMLDACRSASEAQSLATQGQQMFQQLEAFPFPVVAAIHGPCLGGGLELALACDYRVCSDDDKTRLGLPEVMLGLLPGSGGTQRLPRLIGLLPALDLILTGKQLRANKAKKLGVVDACVPESVLLDVAQRFITDKGKKRGKVTLSVKEKLMANTGFGRKVIFDQARKKTAQKTRGNYPAADAILEVIETGLDKGFKAGLAKEATRFGELVMTPESKALRSIFFATTEMKKEYGSDAKPRDIQRVSVLGGGLMGAGISHVSVAKAKLPVRIKDVSNDGILNALSYNYKLFDKQRKRRIISKSQLQSQMMKLSGGTDFTGFQHLDVVIEAVFEDLPLKQQMVAEVEQHAQPDTIFATNTSSLPIKKIAEKAARPENIVGLHYFSPVEKMPLVEVIPHSTTSADTIATVVALAKQQGKTPIVVKDCAGFYVNRILAPYMNEAAKVLLAGEPIEKIDAALLNFGFPVGPITLLDEVGIDVGSKIMPILVNELGPRFQGPEVFEALLNDNRKGRKTGKGFYSYKGGKKKQVDKSVYKLLKLTPESKWSDKEIALRCVLPMLNEAVRCLDDGIIHSARDGDIGAIFGIGFPPFLGGPFRYMDQLGLKTLVEMMNQHAQKYGDHFAPCDGLVTRAGLDETFY
ncbi:fatty acid oxidation complex subunit alpha FadJ [Vibrio cincinnatiensis]|jgi:3-hydroxyacyl-CoA dehydrogenase/enoyl-CoA hydratase/3-hydroxybutyryl-CoA epimerase|uniref:Fatty acid oxidation complex subunit alpha n=1 Tax=Vibrio cincinnatiensis DSM 19608 TaxID=1123491 RepID=A0A1T4L9M2_VIBCI|nr:fatty acid oxidation complex subunit alpha FadJ [Vibrio cincinnatiensis]MCG3724744.1 fatty acid oxidation complex subunit alpha FadJ [Vibrio cincinnatiensis]MCG3736761.1 fatty acid oxidation complex subunit alpha FadJ [Vibrio cincinnatiensis]MCG3747492.1 fatty acid oxidation complex subunit alpha FadJ [Vibrio cincinnatiensis]SJZ51271.1 3-hydroxyacyl-CoA dehydrogenase / enoyl-CoA hydratase / 3-hydroxybutyryl-CoA epimerase [Vibrio cincinnatiensis DSM 19608]SUP48142.1 fatty oxidation complex, 